MKKNNANNAKESARKLFITLVSVHLIWVSHCDNPITSEKQNTKGISVVSVQTVTDTTISYGSYPSLPNELNIYLSNNEAEAVGVKWELELTPVVPGTYKAGNRSRPSMSI